MRGKVNNKWLVSALVIISFLIYNIVAFGLIGYNGKQFIVTYIFTLIAYASMLIMIWITAGKDNQLKDIFLGIPVLRNCVIYVVIQTVLSFIIMLLPDSLFILSLVIQLLVVAVYWFWTISLLGAKNTIENIDHKVKKKRNYLELLKIEVETMKTEEKDEAVRGVLGELAETIKYSDPMSAVELESMENEILEMVMVLESEQRDMTKEEKLERINKISNKVNVRNMKCKMLK